MKNFIQTMSFEIEFQKTLKIHLNIYVSAILNAATSVNYIPTYKYFHKNEKEKA